MCVFHLTYKENYIGRVQGVPFCVDMLQLLASRKNYTGEHLQLLDDKRRRKIYTGSNEHLQHLCHYQKKRCKESQEEESAAVTCTFVRIRVPKAVSTR